MKRGIDNGILLGNLDANHHNITSPGIIDDANLLHEGDTRLSDARPMLDGSVTDESVVEDAAISQSKLRLAVDGDPMPPSWLGPGGAAPFELTERIDNRGALGGHPSLQANGKMPSNSTPLFGSGRVTVIDIEFPLNELAVVPEETGTDRLFTLYWTGQLPNSFFGNISGVAAAPTFYHPKFSINLIPDFDASKITSEMFPVEQLPVAVGVGASHSAGVAPAPGASITPNQSTDYLARDITYKPMQTLILEQPTLPTPTISVQSYYQSSAYINIASLMTGVNLFYKTASSAFTEVTTLPLLIPIGVVVQAYSAKIGYNNSEIAMYTISPPPHV